MITDYLKCIKDLFSSIPITAFDISAFVCNPNSLRLFTDAMRFVPWYIVMLHFFSCVWFYAFLIEKLCRNSGCILNQKAAYQLVENCSVVLFMLLDRDLFI